MLVWALIDLNNPGTEFCVMDSKYLSDSQDQEVGGSGGLDVNQTNKKQDLTTIFFF